MSNGYTPREGTLAHKVIEHLASGKVAAVDAADVAREFGCVTQSVNTPLRRAVEAGLLVATKVGRCIQWTLPEAPPPPEPTDGKLQIATWNDGDVTVKGGTENQDGSVTYSREQMQMLLLHVTVPYIAIPYIVAAPMPAVQE